MNKIASIITMAIGLVLSAQLMATDAKDSSSTPSKYSNLYHRNTELPLVTAYLAGAKEYSPEQLDELSKYDAILVSIDTFIHETESKANLPLEGRFLQEIFERESLSRHSQEVHKEKGIKKRLEEVHKTKGTSIGITIALDAHAPDLIVNSQKKPVDHDLVIEVVKGYDFIHEINIDLKIQDIKNEMNKYKQFFDELGDHMDRKEISITVSAPKNVDEAEALHHLVDPLNPFRPIINVYINPRQEFSPTTKRLAHHSNLYGSQDDAWSTDKSLEFLIEDMQFDPKQLRLGYSNEVRNAQSLFKGKDQSNSTAKQSSIKKTKSINEHIPLTTILGLSPIEGRRAEKKSGYYLITDTEHNVDYVFERKGNFVFDRDEDYLLEGIVDDVLDSNKGRYLSIETPRTVFVKAQYANNKNLGGLFTHHKNNDGSQLLLNAAREGLGYYVRKPMIAMELVLDRCGHLVDKAKCQELTFIDDQKPVQVTTIIDADNQLLDELFNYTKTNDPDYVTAAKQRFTVFKSNIPATAQDMGGVTVATNAFRDITFTNEQYEAILHLHRLTTEHRDDGQIKTVFQGLLQAASMSLAFTETAEKYNITYSSLKEQSSNPDATERTVFGRSDIGKYFSERAYQLMNPKL